MGSFISYSSVCVCVYKASSISSAEEATARSVGGRSISFRSVNELAAYLKRCLVPRPRASFNIIFVFILEPLLADACGYTDVFPRGASLCIYIARFVILSCPRGGLYTIYVTQGAASLFAYRDDGATSSANN